MQRSFLLILLMTLISYDVQSMYPPMPPQPQRRLPYPPPPPPRRLPPGGRQPCPVHGNQQFNPGNLLFSVVLSSGYELGLNKAVLKENQTSGWDLMSHKGPQISGSLALLFKTASFYTGLEGGFTKRWASGREFRTSNQGMREQNIAHKRNYFCHYFVGQFWNNQLLYAKMGWVRGHWSCEIKKPQYIKSLKASRNGLSLGGGIKVGLTPSLMVGLEFLHDQYTNTKDNSGFSVARLKTNNFKINFNFIL